MAYLYYFLKLVYNYKTLNHQYTNYSCGNMFLFSMFLFLLKSELYLYHWDSLLLYPISFIICFIWKADLLLIVCEEQVYHEMNAFIQLRILMFVISHPCCWDAEAAAGGKEDFFHSLSPAWRVVWLKKHSRHSAIEFESLNSFNDKNIFRKNPNNMINFHIKVQFQFSF